MNSRGIVVHFAISLRAIVRGAVAALLLFCAAAEVGSESKTVTTYYPSPAGIYNTLGVTGNAYLGVNGGNVGIGTTSPQAKLHVNGAVHVGADLRAASVSATGNGSVTSDLQVNNAGVVISLACTPASMCVKTGNTYSIVVPPQSSAYGEWHSLSATTAELTDTCGGTARNVVTNGEGWTGRVYTCTCGKAETCNNVSIDPVPINGQNYFRNRTVNCPGS